MIPQFEEIRIQALKELSAGIVMRAKDYAFLWLSILD